jgi:hypothetical protein
VSDLTTYNVVINDKPLEVKVKKTGMDYWTGKETKKLYALKLEDDSWCYADLAEPVTEQEVTKFLTWMMKPDLKHFRHAAAMFKASGTLLRWQQRIIGTSPEALGAKNSSDPTPSNPKAQIVAPAKPVKKPEPARATKAPDPTPSTPKAPIVAPAKPVEQSEPPKAAPAPTPTPAKPDPTPSTPKAPIVATPRPRGRPVGYSPKTGKITPPPAPLVRKPGLNLF